MPETLERDCVVCGASLEITVFDDGTYEGGHYWDLPVDEHDECWECERCYENAGRPEQP